MSSTITPTNSTASSSSRCTSSRPDPGRQIGCGKREQQRTRCARIYPLLRSMNNGELPQRAAAVIVGGGVMGASVAYHLAGRGLSDVLLLERDEFFGQGATGKCAGGIRHQFGSEINVRLSIESIRMLERFEDELGQPIGLRMCGYLFLLSRPEDVAAFRENV